MGGEADVEVAQLSQQKEASALRFDCRGLRDRVGVELDAQLIAEHSKLAQNALEPGLELTTTLFIQRSARL